MFSSTEKLKLLHFLAFICVLNIIFFVTYLILILQDKIFYSTTMFWHHKQNIPLYFLASFLCIKSSFSYDSKKKKNNNNNNFPMIYLLVFLIIIFTISILFYACSSFSILNINLRFIFLWIMISDSLRGISWLVQNLYFQCGDSQVTLILYYVSSPKKKKYIYIYIYILYITLSWGV